MTSGEYLKQLEKYLRKLPQSDYEDAMEYFTEYFADAGPENEQAVIKELGTPKQAAAELMRNLLDKKVDEREAMEKEEKQKEKKKTTGANVVWIAILALFAAPIGAPILISILIVLLCAALCAALLDMSVFLIAVVGVAAGIKMLLRGILAVSVSFGGFCFITGMGVFMLGISILCAVFGVYFAKWMGRLFVWCTRKVTKKGGSRICWYPQQNVTCVEMSTWRLFLTFPIWRFMQMVVWRPLPYAFIRMHRIRWFPQTEIWK